MATTPEGKPKRPRSCFPRNVTPLTRPAPRRRRPRAPALAVERFVELAGGRSLLLRCRCRSVRKHQRPAGVDDHLILLEDAPHGPGLAALGAHSRHERDHVPPDGGADHGKLRFAYVIGGARRTDHHRIGAGRPGFGGNAAILRILVARQDVRLLPAVLGVTHEAENDDADTTRVCLPHRLGHVAGKGREGNRVRTASGVEESRVVRRADVGELGILYDEKPETAGGRADLLHNLYVSGAFPVLNVGLDRGAVGRDRLQIPHRPAPAIHARGEAFLTAPQLRDRRIESGAEHRAPPCRRLSPCVGERHHASPSCRGSR